VIVKNVNVEQHANALVVTTKNTQSDS